MATDIHLQNLRARNLQQVTKERSQHQRNLSNGNEEDVPAEDIPLFIPSDDYGNTPSRLKIAKKPLEKPPQRLEVCSAGARSENISGQFLPTKSFRFQRIHSACNFRSFYASCLQSIRPLSVDTYGAIVSVLRGATCAFASGDRSRRTVDLYKASHGLVDVDRLVDTVWQTLCQTASSGKSARSLNFPRH